MNSVSRFFGKRWGGMKPPTVGVQKFRKEEKKFVLATKFRKDCDELPEFGRYVKRNGGKSK